MVVRCLKEVRRGVCEEGDEDKDNKVDEKED